MKKISLFAILLLVGLSLGHVFVYAESDDSGSDSRDISGSQFQNREESGRDFKPFLGTLSRPEKVEVGGEAEKHMSKKAMVEHRFMGALNMLDYQAARLANVIDQLHTSGLDTTDASAKLVIAQGKIATAKTAVDALKSYVSGIAAASISPDTSGNRPMLTTEQKDQIKHLAEVAKQKIIDAHQALKDAHQAVVVLLGDDENSGDNNSNGQDEQD